MDSQQRQAKIKHEISGNNCEYDMKLGLINDLLGN